MRTRQVAQWLADAAAVTAAWGLLLLAENVALWFLARDQFSASWEIALARHTAVPMALAALAPLSPIFVAVWRLSTRASAGGRREARVLGLLGAAAAAAVAVGISGGRHFENWILRVAFVATLATLGELLGRRVAPRIASLRGEPAMLLAFGFALACASWLADRYVLPRLYVGFHAAMLVGCLLGAGLVGMAVRSDAEPGIAGRLWAAIVAAVVVGCAAWTPRAARLLDRATNLRIALVEHAPLLGRAVAVSARLRAQTPADGDDGAVAAAPVGEVRRSLDWSGRDLVLLSIDALRADHVSAYGYARPTTPNIDALAREGAIFEHAYCPTPHTSYSVTSLLTGKYLRPLLALGLGEDSETWAQAVQRYGWRTAAFYPPAVFFIDENRFERFEKEHLGFEYAKVEFADPVLREKQVAAYLEGAPPDVPIFLWVHFFEPHEPYVAHPEHPFSGGSSADIDAYDSEVAMADEGVGRIARLVRMRRPNAVFLVTADHGEEFGDHGGRYHGTTVYDEQVRVPMVVVGPGVRKASRIESVVQTIDLMPTALSALGIPRPARLRGRDRGPLMTGAAAAADPGFAYSEADDYSLIATGDDRLVCQRRAAACALFRNGDDPRQHRDLAGESGDRVVALRGMLRTVERDHGRYEASEGPPLPEALRRGIQGDADAALDVASLLDDVDPSIRRKAAEVCFRLRVAATAPALRRALGRDEDSVVLRWASLALARLGESTPTQGVEALLADADREWRRRAAWTLGELGDARACEELASWWEEGTAPLATEAGSDGPAQVAFEKTLAEELLFAIGRARCRSAVPALLRSMGDVRIRSAVADALGSIGDRRARGPLLDALANEPYVTTQPHEARALLTLGVRDWSAVPPPPAVRMDLRVTSTSSRLLVLLSDRAASIEARADGVALAETAAGTEVRTLELGHHDGRSVRIELRASTGGVEGAWLLPNPAKAGLDHPT